MNFFICFKKSILLCELYELYELCKLDDLCRLYEYFMNHMSNFKDNNFFLIC